MGHARTTRDLDLNVPPPPLEDLLDDLQRAADLDVGDFFEFVLSPARAELAGPPLGGYRFAVEARLDGRLFNRFPVDIGQGDVTVREPEWVAGQVDLTFAGIATPTFAIYPLEDQFAEKLHTYTAPRENPSRVKDLVDMLLILELGLEPSPLLQRSIEATFERYARHLHPGRLPQPPEVWRAPFAVLAEEVDLDVADLDAAYEKLRAFMAEVQQA